MEAKKLKWAWVRKFGYAFRGIYTSLKEEVSLVVHFVIAAIVLILAGLLNSYFGDTAIIDWAILVIVVGVIIGMELINTAIENLVDMVSFKYNYNAKKIKDVAAAATLVMTLMAIIVGLLIFIPPMITFFSGL